MGDGAENWHQAVRPGVKRKPEPGAAAHRPREGRFVRVSRPLTWVVPRSQVDQGGVMKARSPEKQLDGFIARYSPEVGALARAALAKMRTRLPGAIELVYDNYNALAIGFSPTERTSDAIFSIALWPRWVSLFFLQGAGLPDPHRLLQGSGKVARHLVLAAAEDLDRPEVQDLIAAALARARTPLVGTGPGRIVIKSVSARQRPRRPAK
jgi:hypothetical protein